MCARPIVTRLLALVGLVVIGAACGEDGQPDGGDGWTLLGRIIDIDGEEPHQGRAWETAVALDATRHSQIAIDWGVVVAVSEVDFEEQITIFFGHPISETCWDTRLMDVVFDHERGIVHGEWETVEEDEGCVATEELSAFIVAVDRDRLPPSPFRIQINDGPSPAGRDEAVTVVQTL